MKIEKVKIDELVSPDYNPRQITDEELSKLETSLKEFGYIEPIIVNDVNNHIVGGNQRAKALKTLGYEEAEAVYVHIEDLAKEKACNVALNKISGEWDTDKLKVVLEDIELSDIDVSLTGFGEIELTKLEIKDPTDIEEDDYNFNESEDIEVTVKKGEIYQLGNHRLMCGDSTSNDLEKLMNNNKADMVFTDPPYLMGFTGTVNTDGSKSYNSKHGTIKNDKMSREDGDQFILKIFTQIMNYNRGAYYVCFYRLGLDYIFRALDELNNQYKALIIWNKGNHTLSNSDYMSKYEPIIYGWFNEHNFYGDRSNFDIWDIKRTSKNTLHPTMKPIQLCSKAIQNSSRPDDIVLDLFGGSGSTLMACEQLQRKCYTMELDEKYCTVIINRWEQYTGEKATKIN